MNKQLSRPVPFIELPMGSGPWNIDQMRRVASAVDEACRHTGYFFLSHHAVSADLLAAAFDETHQFYSRPLDQKSKFNCSAQSQFLGYRGLGAEKSRMHAGGEACEQYRIGNIVVTPASQALVDLYHEPFSQGTILFQELVKLGSRLMSTCSIGLGLVDIFFDSFMDEPMHRLGLNYYAVGAGQAISNSVSYAMTSHVDHAVFTILTQDEPGLEVLSPGGEWIDVPLNSGSLFMFLGDYMERWTNGVYRSTPHRVRAVSNNRMSLQYKHRPSYATVVAPLRPFVDEEHPARYEAFDTGRQYAELLQSLLTPQDASHSPA
jgi:isopenicillin N synthase-like dioxygenase